MYREKKRIFIDYYSMLVKKCCLIIIFLFILLSNCELFFCFVNQFENEKVSLKLEEGI